MSGAASYRSLEDEVRLRRPDSGDLQLFALVDGARYLTLDKRLEQARERWAWLLAGSELDAIKHAGPALVHLDQASELQGWLARRDQQSPWVSWLLSRSSFDALSQHLGSLLFAHLPDGRRSLFRYYNPVVRRALESVLTAQQQRQMMTPIDHWLIWQPLEGRYLELSAKWREASHA